MEQILALFGKMKGASEALSITSSKFLNSDVTLGERAHSQVLQERRYPGESGDMAEGG